LDLLGERTCIVDCDVIQADGGTRTAAVTGGYVALALGLRKRIADREVHPRVLRGPVAAISVGVVEGRALLDLDYNEDFRAEVDLNLVMNGAGDFIEIQGTAEGEPFSREKLDQLLDLGWKGISELITTQREVLQQAT
jgi:ribonuclease PH